MAKKLKNAIERSGETLLGDALGFVALAVVFYVGLTVPTLF